MIFGIDISHHQGGSFDLRRAAREGIQFAILKATEGAGFVDRQFNRNLREARAAGLLVAAYHYQRSGVSAAAQANHIAKHVPRDVPIIQDVEAGGGTVGLTRQLHGDLRRRGFTVPLLYLPEWYWREIGSPNLAGLPPLWYSRYPNYQGGSASAIWNRHASWFGQFWRGYGGLPVAILQFTSSATVAGHSPVDGNAYRGSRAQLAALLGGQQEEDDVQPQDINKIVTALVKALPQAIAWQIKMRNPNVPKGKDGKWATEPLWLFLSYDGEFRTTRRMQAMLDAQTATLTRAMTENRAATMEEIRADQEIALQKVDAEFEELHAELEKLAGDEESQQQLVERVLAEVEQQDDEVPA